MIPVVSRARFINCFRSILVALKVQWKDYAVLKTIKYKIWGKSYKNPTLIKQRPLLLH
jgi:hypothetical protein